MAGITGPLHLNRRLSVLSFCNVSLTAYYQKLLEDGDEYLRVAAICGLLELGKLGIQHWRLAVSASNHGAVRTRAFTFFTNLHEYELAREVMDAKVTELNEIVHMRMRAGLENDLASLQNSEQLLFLADGNVSHLSNAKIAAETRAGWKAAVAFGVQALLAQPANPDGPYFLLRLLLEANQTDWLDQATGAFSAANVYKAETLIFSAASMSAKGAHKDALKLLQSVQLNGLSNRLQALFLKTRAAAFERTQDYAQAYNTYVRLNAVEKRPDLSTAKFKDGIETRAAYEFELLPPDARASNYFIMLGFPRSGTTLLENVLSSHSEIETFEEIPALLSARQLLEREAVRGQPFNVNTALRARARYYTEMDRLKQKSHAGIFIDKMPIYSTEAHFLSRLFPEKKYIFSVRNPFDVTLSCFRQFFSPNAAMENFRTLSGACELYDFAMNIWFSAFGEDNVRVHYVKYENLVEDFQAVTGSVTSFLGVTREAGMDDFASRSEERAARTPSYQMVRAGLKAGVQSSWQNYRQFFTKRDVHLLNPWAEKFGYQRLD